MRVVLLTLIVTLLQACGPDPPCQTNASRDLDGDCSCDREFEPCGRDCVDAQRDPTNCGGCGVTCAADERCEAGVCCGPGHIVCGGACVDLSADASHCGACGTHCRDDEVCVDGTCGCAPGTAQCGWYSECVSVLDDPYNCGACDATCGVGQSCVDGACACGAGLARCDGRCRDLVIDGANCGACGAPCALDEVCLDGACACPLGTTRCGSGCVSLDRDTSHCGSCDTACADDELCDRGSCEAVAMSDGASYVSRFQVRVPPLRCCANLDGWPGEDSVFEEGLDPTDRWLQQDAWDQLILDDIGSQAMTYGAVAPDGVGGELVFDVVPASNDLDGDGSPDQPISVRRGPDGVFVAAPTGRGPARFRGSLADGLLFAEADALTIPLPSAPHAALLREPTLEGTVAASERGLTSVDDDLMVEDREIRFGGIHLAGWIAVADLVIADLAHHASACPCLAGQVIVIGVDEMLEHHVVEVHDGHGCTSSCAERLNEIAARGLRFATLADIDTDANGLPDALSVGLYLTLTETTLVEEER